MLKSNLSKDSSKLEATYGPSLTMSVPEAGWKYYGLKRMASYAAAKRGDIVTITVGGRLRAVTAAMDELMARAAEAASADA